MTRLRVRLWLSMFGLVGIALKAWGVGSELWTINLCAISTTNAAHMIATPGSSFEPCTSEPRGDRIFRWYGLVGRRAMLRGEYADGINILQRLVQLRPDDMFAHFWLAQLYDQSREAALAIQEYTWLADRLPSKQGGGAGIEWLDQKSKADQNLDVLLSGKKLVDQGSVSEGIAALHKLNALDPHNTLASYYLYRAYIQLGDTPAADNLLPELAFITYGTDERWHQLLNDVLPDLAIPLAKMGYWEDIQVANMASFLAWRGDLVNSSRLLDFGNQLWPDNELLAEVTSDVQQRRSGANRPCLACVTGSSADPLLECTPDENATVAQTNRLLSEVERPQFGVEATPLRFGPNLLNNGSFERQNQGFPGSWFFARSVTLNAATNRWETASDFSPSAGVDSMALCDGSHSARLQVIWDRSQGDDLFAAISQQVSLTEPGTYVLGICYLAPHGTLALSVTQGDQILFEAQLPSSTAPCGYSVQLLRVERIDHPLFVTAKLYGAGWAWVDGVSLQHLNSKLSE